MGNFIIFVLQAMETPITSGIVSRAMFRKKYRKLALKAFFIGFVVFYSLAFVSLHEGYTALEVLGLGVFGGYTMAFFFMLGPTENMRLRWYRYKKYQ